MRVRICPLDELPDGEARAASAGNAELAVFNVDGNVYALDNQCRHANGPLAEGTVVDGVVTCPWHWWRYDIETGRRLGSDEIVQPKYEAAVEDGMIVVEVPDPQPELSMRDQLLAHAREWKRDE